MKKSLFFTFMLLALSAFTFSSCKDDDSSDPPAPGNFAFAGKNYPISGSWIEISESANAQSDKGVLYFANGSGFIMVLNLFIPAGSDELAVGTYINDNSLGEDPMTFSFGRLDEDGDGDGYFITDGSLVVSKSDKYTIKVNCKTNNYSEYITGIYTGSVDVELSTGVL